MPANPLISLGITVAILGVLAAAGYTVYLVATDVAAQASRSMERRHVSVCRDGVRVEVKNLQTEDYVGKTQRWVLRFRFFPFHFVSFLLGAWDWTRKRKRRSGRIRSGSRKRERKRTRKRKEKGEERI